MYKWGETQGFEGQISDFVYSDAEPTGPWKMR